MPAPAFMKLKVDHKTVLCRDLNTYRSLVGFLLNSGYAGVYQTERVEEEKTGMATFACRSGLTGDLNHWWIVEAPVVVAPVLQRFWNSFR